jgi:hypothetical protein
LDWVIQNAGFLEWLFKQCYLFEQWGSTLAVVAGVCWFVYFVFCWYYSSLAGTPWMGFMRDEFGWSKNKGASFLDNDFSFRFPTVILRKECLMNMIIGLER